MVHNGKVTDTLVDWVAKINIGNTSNLSANNNNNSLLDTSIRAKQDGSSEHDSSSDGSDSSSDNDDDDDDDDGSSLSSGDVDSVDTDVSSKDSRTRFLEEDDEILSSTESLTGSRMSKNSNSFNSRCSSTSGGT